MSHSLRPVAAFEDVRVWHGRTDLPPIDLLPLLSPDERERAATFGRDDLRRRFIVRRGLLRRQLGEIAGVAPERLIFSYGPRGKPSLEGLPLHFNLSHRGENFLLAVADRREVGVDLERVDDDEPLDSGHLRDNFAPSERILIGRDPALFWRAWTRKEACIKALGVGLSVPLPAFVVLRHESFNDVEGLPLDRGLRITDVRLPGPLAGAVATLDERSPAAPR